MTREELFRLIHERIEQSPQWEKIKADKVSTQCRIISAGVYEHLTKPENQIDGLSLAVVDGVGFHVNHAWIMAHHKDVGYFMIDPTAGQYLRPRGNAHQSAYADAFIGTYQELQRMISSPDAYTTRGHVCEYWPPYMAMMPKRDSLGKPMHYFYNPENYDDVWSKCDLKIARLAPPEGDCKLGRWAAHMEKQNFDWRAQVRFWVNSDSIQKIEAQRDEYIKHGMDDERDDVKTPKEHLIYSLRKIIAKWPEYEQVGKGNTDGMCRHHSCSLYDFLGKPENQIDGLSLAVVNGSGYRTDHAWLIAFHEDAGFFMIDPTVGQFLYKSDNRANKPYKNVFIGTYNELEQMVLHSGKYTMKRDFYQVWPPSVTLLKPEGMETRFHKPEEVEALWKYNSIPLESEDLFLAPQSGRFAARMEEAGANWQESIVNDARLRGNKGATLEPENAAVIRQHRNQHIRLGPDRDGVPYTEKLGENYRSGHSQPPSQGKH